MYAVFEDGSRQYRVQPGDRVLLDHRDVAPGGSVELDRVLLCSGPSGVLVGTPTVAGASVVGEVVAQVKGPKVKIQKFRRRKNYRRKSGHRQAYTAVRIEAIQA